MSRPPLEAKLPHHSPHAHEVPVVVLNWNGWDDTFTCLASLAPTEASACVWLVDNASCEDHSEEARALLPGLRTLRWDANYGWAGGYNRALRVAATEGFDFAYLLNNDCTVAPGFLTPVVHAAATDPAVATVGSVIVYADPCGFAKFDGEYHSPGEQRLTNECGVRRADDVNGAGMLVRLAAMEQHGWFDERFFCYAEETEWCWRMRDRGWSCAISLDSVVVHKGEGSDVGANALYYRTRNQLLLMRLRLPPDEYTRRQDALIYNYVLNRGHISKSLGPHRWHAVVSAIRDGARGRFGRRPPPPSPWVPNAWLLSRVLWAHVRDKARAMRGLPPGYGSVDAREL